MGILWHPWVSIGTMDTDGQQWVPRGIQEYPWALAGTHGYLWLPLGTVPMGTHGHPKLPMGAKKGATPTLGY